MDWADPLRNLPAPTPHPAPESEASSKLSAVLADSTGWFKSRTEALEELDDRYIPNSPEDDTPKVLRTFAMKLPKRGQLALLSEIHLLKDDSPKLRQLRNFLVDAILKPMMAAGGKSPKILISASPHPDAEDDISASMATLEPSSRKDQKRLKAACLQRDGYRCAVSNKIDKKSRSKVPESLGEIVGKTECAHILPFGLRNFNERNLKETQNKATIWWALRRYFPALKGLIGPDSINQPENALTMAVDLHAEFGDFNLAFEHQGQNRYRTHYLTARGTPIPEVITLKSNEPSIQVPRPEYLMVHFRIGEILQVSGIGEKIEAAWEEDDWDAENIESSGSTDIGSILCRKMLMEI